MRKAGGGDPLFAMSGEGRKEGMRTLKKKKGSALKKRGRPVATKGKAVAKPEGKDTRGNLLLRKGGQLCPLPKGG